jgi:uncharacterized membrane protein YedE/YeeE
MQDLFPLGWQHYLFGGVLIGLGVSLMFVFQGRIVGMSSVFSSTWSWLSRRPYFQQDAFVSTRTWRLLCALGLMLGAALWWVWLGPTEGLHTQVSTWRLLLGGVLVGFGARLSNGCTSGHGICGLSSLSLPSLVAVLVFMGVAIATALSLSALGA